jgi:transcriptional regulator with XRE-family HTH domain
MKDARIVAFGRTVRELRTEKGITQEAFAYLSGVDRSYFGHIERGRKNVTLRMIYQIADGLGMTVVELLQAVQDNQEKHDRKI